MTHWTHKLALDTKDVRELEQALAAERDRNENNPDELLMLNDIGRLAEIHTLVRSAAFLLELAHATATGEPTSVE